MAAAVAMNVVKASKPAFFNMLFESRTLSKLICAAHRQTERKKGHPLFERLIAVIFVL
jgi:hypothetical protein